MIDKIKIENIQSHKNTELNLSNGINVIVGSSNNGKSAILRALYWAIYNRPLGIDTLCSHWALDDKGKQKSDMKVTITKGDDVLIRKKSKDSNLYSINDKVLEAIKTDVPNEVKEFFKLNETNIQKQQDTPFLVSSSNYEVAKYFNSIARLDVIDKVLSYTEQTKRKVRYKIEDMETQSKEYETLIDSYKWVDSIVPKLEEYEQVDSEFNKLNSEFKTISISIIDYENYLAKINSVKSVLDVKEAISEYDNISKEIEQKEYELNEITNTISKYDKLINKVKVFTDIKDVSDKIATYDKLCTKVSTIKQSIDSITDTLDSYRYYTKLIESKLSEVDKLKKQLPTICPLCGNIMKEDN